MKRVTIRDVARFAGVSHQTVSRVINNNQSVAPETRVLIESAISQLGYKPNAAARSLAAGKTNTLACIAPNLMDFTFASIIEGAELFARQNGYFIIAASAPTAEDFDSLLNQLYESKRIDGVIVINPFIDQRSEKLPKTLPAIFIGDESNNDEIGWVALDDKSAGVLAVQHLISLRHEKILIISGLEQEKCTQNRIDGAKQAFFAAKVPWNEEYLYFGDWSATSGYRIIQDAFKKNLQFSAVFAQNDRMAIGAMRALGDAGISVPDQCSVIGIDDMPLAGYFNPPLSTIQQDVTKIGEKAAELLLKKIHSPETKSQQCRFPVKLIVRKTTTEFQR